MDLLLASTSPYRRAQLERLGLPFRCRAPEVDESAFKSRGLPPRSRADRLAAAKAARRARSGPDATTLGGDRAASLNGYIPGKPGSPGGAAEQLALLSGREHELITAIAVVHRDRRIAHTDVTRLTMRRL